MQKVMDTGDESNNLFLFLNKDQLFLCMLKMGKNVNCERWSLLQSLQPSSSENILLKQFPLLDDPLILLSAKLSYFHIHICTELHRTADMELQVPDMEHF
jgi:hypothetical protein